MAMKVCTKCGAEKDVESGFYFNKRQDSYIAACKSCENKRSAAWQKANPDKTVATVKRYANSDKGKARTAAHLARPNAQQKRRQWLDNNPEKLRKYSANYKSRIKLIPEKVAKMKKTQLEHDLARYDITLEQYNVMLSAQGGTCAICHRHPSPNGKRASARLHVDHDHETKEIRGLLCNTCNTGIGLLRDSVFIIESAASYLRVHQDKRIARFIATLPEEEIESLRVGVFE